MSLPFQAVTFDMDATFVHDDKSYDHARFERILSQLEDQGVKVIVSSGNQYECLTNYFPDTKERLLLRVRKRRPRGLPRPRSGADHG